MTNRGEAQERSRWEEQRAQETRDIEADRRPERRLARDAGDPRWGTGGMRVDERAYRPIRDEESRPPSQQAVSAGAWDANGPFVGRGPRGYRRSDDRIREDVCEHFTLSGYLDPSDVDVEVRGGEVMLSGTVATRTQKRLAEDLADAVFGVVEVHNHLRIGRQSSEAEP
jgi:BON domain